MLGTGGGGCREVVDLTCFDSGGMDMHIPASFGRDTCKEEKSFRGDLHNHRLVRSTHFHRHMAISNAA